MDLDEERKPPKRDIVIGEDLAMLSVEELARRIEVLTGEIERLKSVIAEKRKSREAADSVFKV